MPVYEKAKTPVLNRVAKVMKDYHGALADQGVTLDVLMVGPTVSENGEASGPPLKIKGYPCAAIIKVNNLRDRTNGMSDALLQIDEDQWGSFSEAKQNALIDHELEHLELAKDREGAVKVDDLGRPKLKTKPHDREVGWFDSVVRRHEKDSIEWLGFNQIWQQCQQMKLPFMESLG